MKNMGPESGVCVWMTGLSGAGKTTISETTYNKISSSREAVRLDGDDLRRTVSARLGFNSQDRMLNAICAAELAAAETTLGKIVLASLISPYEAIRQTAKNIVERAGSRFVLVHVATPLETCEQRDPKNLYKRARAGEITSFTGISDPYEIPLDPDLVIDTTMITPDEASNKLIQYLADRSLLAIS